MARAFLARAQPKFKLVECVVAENRELAAKPEHGSVRHVELRDAEVVVEEQAVRPQLGRTRKVRLRLAVALAPAVPFPRRLAPLAAVPLAGAHRPGVYDDRRRKRCRYHARDGPGRAPGGRRRRRGRASRVA